MQVRMFKLPSPALALERSRRRIFSRIDSVNIRRRRASQALFMTQDSDLSSVERHIKRQMSAASLPPADCSI